MGVVLDIPLGHKDAAFVRSHFDGMEVRINDAPRANEIMVAIAVTDSGRPLARVGGLTKIRSKVKTAFAKDKEATSKINDKDFWLSYSSCSRFPALLLPKPKKTRPTRSSTAARSSPWMALVHL